MSIDTQPRSIDAAAAADRLIGASEIIITTHARADGDAIGSALGAARALRLAGRNARAYFHEPVPPRYSDLPDAHTALVWPTGDPEALRAAFQSADLLLIVDTCAAGQLDGIVPVLAESSVRKLAIDHHVTRDPIVDEILVDTSAGACTQLIARVCDAAGWRIDPELATLLFAGLATDTGWFRHSNADAVVFATAARLIEAGARADVQYERLYLTEPLARVRLMGAVMSSFELRAHGRLAVIRVTREMLSRCEASSGMTEEVINETHRTGSVIASVMFVEPETPDEPVRVSFRAKRDINVAKVAQRFGGGGHACAAGAKLRETFDNAVRRVVEALEHELSSS
ncbi:MAG: DHH family phosphoesterase [Phycisphaerae bacterium]|nr:DHH family phosphoesterase [Phycisphaerae bacterium]